MLVRHAESKFNAEINHLKQFKSTFSPDLYESMHWKIRFSKELIDCEITEKGVEQCVETGKELVKQKIKIGKVFVSPMKRALQTCDKIIEAYLKENKKNGNNISPPKIAVHPLLFEKIEDSCDLVDIKRNMQMFSGNNWALCHVLKHLPLYQLDFCDGNVNKKKENYLKLSLETTNVENCYEFL